MTLRFLVVDDEPDVLALVRANVRAWGHECRTAATADDARRLIAEERPDVLLLDVAMPEGDGVELLHDLRRSGLEPEHVYLLSALPPEQLVELSSELGVPHISKPFTAPQLRDIFSRFIEGATR